MIQMKNYIPFLLYVLAIAGFCLYRKYLYQESFEEIRPYVHEYKTAETQIVSEESVFPVTETEKETKPVIITEPESFPITESITEAPEMLVPETEENTEIQFPIELNAADFTELCALPEIGSVTAQAILDYREAIGGFLNRQQLLDVPGIGEYKYALILPYLYLEIEYPLPEPEIIPETIPEITEVIEETEPSEETLPPEIPVLNLNTATKEQLMLLPDCDEALAEEIITLRDRDIHQFYHILEITLAEHVTPELFAKWENYLTVDDDGSTQIPYVRTSAQE